MFENKYLYENKVIFSLVKINWYTLITKNFVSPFRSCIVYLLRARDKTGKSIFKTKYQRNNLFE